ncbi:3-beta hydroxysteroid dehydrogenase/isomerase family-domain-containing protein [Gorgonomyces haynaldii]|nr:3-beta hydroxysteroid dehydrogenase/isomerase family-domain-containing protein [Gorgonomyces haynaldii]
MKGVKCVIHTASPIHGKPSAVYFKVNVEGTHNIIAACKRNNVQKLVFTSSCGVIYNGQDLINADETTPYCKVHMDAYNETKAIAEEAVLKANGDGLYTCSIRPSGIFGPHDAQGSLAIVEAAERGQYKVKIGANQNLFDVTYVDNAAHCHILAADKLGVDELVGGQAFIVTNDQPVFFWDYPSALLDGLGYKGIQRTTIPLSVGFALAYMVDAFVALLSPFVVLHPTLTAFRIKVVSGTRYFNINKAKTILGYKPIVPYEEAIRRTVEFWRSEGRHNKA